MLRRVFLVILPSAAVVLGCHSITRVCPETLTYAIALTLVDSVTGQPPSLPSRVTVTGTNYRDTAAAHSGNVYYLALGRTGDLAVLVQTTGYTDWTQKVLVQATSCGEPIPVTITARLQR
jgi:hypothetical protein